MMSVVPIMKGARVPPSVTPVKEESAAHWAGQMAAVAANRDVEAFMRVFAYFGPRVKRYLCGLRVSEPAADDLVQETMLRVWRHAAQFDPTRATLSTWLFRIARNLYIDSVRRQPHWIDTQDALERLDATGSELGQGEWLADGEVLERAIAALPAGQARMLRMAYFEAKSHTEIAHELDVPLGSVKSVLRRTILKLQVVLGDHK
jgi:RNA polymerase sigma-70 factor (ECF subfamily)